MAYPNRRGKGWYADRRAGSRRRRKLFPNKALAELFESQQKLKMLHGEVGITDSEPVTLREFFKRYYERHTSINKKESTQHLEPFMMVTINEHLGNLRLRLCETISDPFGKSRLW